MYAICKTSHTPTQIEHSIYCHFYNQNDSNLVVAGATQLKVFRLIRESEESSEESPSSSSESSLTHHKVRLECCQSFTLFGNVMSLESVSLSGSSRDSLILAFSDAKLSIVEYDPNTHDLKTLSLHYFEEEEMRCGFTQFIHVPIVRADPESRCAALIIYNRNIVILPFRKDVTSDEHDVGTLPTPSTPSVTPSTTFSAKSPVMASYKLDLNSEQYGEKVNNIIDIQFLHNYYEPTLLILYEPVRTWAGRVAVRQDTCAMLVLSLNVQQKVHPHIWSMSHLPYDCIRALAVPKPIGGVLIFANNSLIHLNQGLPPYGVSLNCFNDACTSFPLKPQSDVKLSLDCSQVCFISNDKLVISVKNGDIYVLTLFNDMTRSIRGFNFDKAASSVLPTCVTMCEDGYLFLGSRLGHSLLLHYTEKPYECLKALSPKEEKNDVTDANDDIVMKDEENKDKDDAESNDKDIAEAEAEAEDKDKDKDKDKDIAEDKVDKNGEVSGDDSEEPQAKKLKEEENIVHWFAGDVALIEDPDILEVYGPTPNIVADKEIQTSLAFEVSDSIINIGPCGKICMGEPAMSADEFSGNSDPDIELVTTSGYAKNGALCVIQRSIRPQIVTTFELPGCTDMWTVYGPQPRKAPHEKSDSQEDAPSHAFLILSRPEATMILQTGQEINELDQSGFSSQTSTIFAGNLGGNQYIIQVSAMGVRLLDGVRELQHVPIDVGAPICYTSLADPYAVLLSGNGVILLLCLKLENNARLLVLRPELSAAKSKIVALCIYKDTSGMFTTEKKVDDSKDNEPLITQEKVKHPTMMTSHPLAIIPALVDDEDELLYGDSKIDTSNFFTTAKSGTNEEQNKPNVSKVHEIKDHDPTYWLFIVRENGVLEIFSLPDFKLVYLVKNFPMAPKVLVDSVQITDHIGAQQQQDVSTSLPITRELLMIGMGLKQTRPIFFARFDDDLLIYEAFSFYETQVDNHLKIRFKKLPHIVLVKEPKIARPSKVETENPSDQTSTQPITRMWLRPFYDISGYSGVFLCGPYPHWFFMTYRGELRSHEMSIDGPVSCFSPFHNVNCPKGFLYFNKNDELRICALTTHLNYDSPWPVRKVPLRCTPHFIHYHVDTKTYCVVTSTLEEVTKIVRIGGEEKDYDILERDARYIYPAMEKFCLQLLSPVSWEMIPGTIIELEEWEHITCMKNVMLASEGTSTGLKGYIALGTNYNYGEDVTNRGRIMILDIIDVVPEPGQPLTRNRIKIAYCKEQKGPVTTLCHVKGFLLSAIGQKIYIWQLKESQLNGVAFIDTQIYIHSAISLKNLILVADVYKSISLLRYQEETRTLSLVSKDPRCLQVYACDYVIDNTHMCFIISDSDKNLILYSYQPDFRESFGGTRLIRRADFHFGSHVNSFFRIRCRIPSKDIDKRTKQMIQNKQLTMFASLDGSIGCLFPISEKTYRRLLMLQNVLTTSLQHIAGLNPKAFRALKVQKPELLNPAKNILDGDLLNKYLLLSMNEKSELSKKIGTSPKQIIDDLHEIDRLTAYF